MKQKLNEVPQVNKNPDARGEARRRQIVDAAIEAFSEKGFAAASTRDIAHRAGTDQGLVTYHFPNKDSLWRAAADSIFGDLGQELDNRIATSEIEDPKERARSGIREFVRQAAAHPEIFRFMLDEGNRTDARMRWLVDTHIIPRFAFMKTQGVVSVTGMDESLALHAFFALAGAGSVIFAVAPIYRRLSGQDPRSHEVIERHADFIANLMIP